jgi:hypothetical protein
LAYTIEQLITSTHQAYPQPVVIGTLTLWSSNAT